MQRKFSDLRKKAEKTVTISEIDISKLSDEEIKGIIHNLEVHKVELELQNNELLNAQKQTIEARDKYFELFEFAPAGFVALNRGFVITDTNSAFSTLTDCSKEKLIGKPLTDFVAPDFQDNVFLALRKLIKTGEGQSIELKTLDKTPTGKWVRAEFHTRDGGETILISFLDVSEQKAAEQKLRESEERFRMALDAASDGIWDWNFETDEIYFSPNWKKMLGYEPHEIENKFSMWEELTNPDDVKKSWKNLEQYIQGKTNRFNVEFKMKHKDGHWVDVLSRAVASVRHTDGKPKRIIGTHVDITQQKRVQKMLTDALTYTKKTRSEIEELLKATHAILKMNDFQKAAKEIFEACKRSIGAKAGYVALLSDMGEENELLFLDDGGLQCDVDPELPMPVRGLRAEAYRTGKVVYDNNFMQSEWIKFMPAGHLELPNVLFAPLNIEGKTVGVIGISNKESDFTENDARLAGAFGEYAAISLQNSRTFEKLEKRAAELAELNATKDKLFSIIGHDLKNPIGNIISFAGLIDKNYEKYNDEKIKKFNGVISKSAKSVSALLESLLQWSRAQRGTMQIQKQTHNLHKTTDNQFIALSGQAQLKGVKLINNLDKEAIVNTDIEMLSTVIRNLISNAIKFTPTNGEIVVSAHQTDNKTIIEVKDTGVGIPKERIKDLFKPDALISQTGTDGEKGTGLGLIICKEFINKLGGELNVKSEIDKGSTFIISLPLV